MSIEWDSLIFGGNELNTVGPATEKYTVLINFCNMITVIIIIIKDL